MNAEEPSTAPGLPRPQPGNGFPGGPQVTGEGRRKARPGGLQIRGLRLSPLLVLAALLGAPAAFGAEPPTARIAPSYDRWLEAVGPFASEREEEVFRGLGTDVEREHFIDAFWERRRGGERERFAENREAAEEALHRARDMDRVMALAGKPEEQHFFYSCGALLRRFAVWEFSPWQVEHQGGPAGSAAGSEGASVVFYQETRGDPRTFRVWSPAAERDLEVLGGGPWRESLLEDLEAGDRERCLGKLRPETLLEDFVGALDLPELARRFGWQTPEAEIPVAYDSRRHGVGRLETDYPGKFFHRTILRGRVRLPVESLASPEGGFLFDRVTIQGDVYRGLQLVDGFQLTYHLAGTVPTSQEVTLDFYRRLFPSAYDLELRVLGGRGEVLLREDRPLTVPRMAEDAPFPAGRRGDYNQLTRTEVVSLVTFPSVRLLPPSSEHVPGKLRLQAVTSGGPIAAVEFFRGDASLGRDSEPPYLAETDLLQGEQSIRVVALDPEGRPLAADQRTVVTRSHGFRVELPERPSQTSGELVVEVTIPAGDTLTALECWLDDRRIAVLVAAPYRCPASLPARPAPTFARAVGRLASGAEAEDVVFLSADPAEEVEVRVAELYVSVVDGDGRPVTDVRAEEFQVLEGGRDLEVVSAEGIRSLPLNVAVAMDTSSSMGRRVRTASASAQRFFESLLEPKDRASLISFNHDLRRRVAFTNDVEALRYGALGARAYGATRLWDALTFSVSSFAGLPDRRALVALTDGSDTESDFTYDQVQDAALRARVMVFPVTLARLDEETDADLEALARATGGVSFRARDISELDRVYSRIEDLLRSQYLIVYRRAAAEDRPREAAAVEVRIRRPGLVAHSVRRKL